MESVIKAYMGLFFILMLAALGVGILSASIDARNADSFAANCVTKIENSNYALPVIEACRQDALSNGYGFEIETFDSAGVVTTGLLTVDYEFSVPMLKLLDRRTVTAFMR